MSRENALGDITLFLRRLRDGDRSAENPLAEAVYAHMRYLARTTVGPQRNDISLPATALAHEVLMQLIRVQTVDWKDREHFYRIASRLLRRRLIDYIRTTRAAKRPPKYQALPLELAMIPVAQQFDEILQVHDSLEQLAQKDPPMAELIEMIYFGGFAIKEVAQMRGVSEKTIDRQLDFARRWMTNNLKNGCPRALAKAASFDRA